MESTNNIEALGELEQEEEQEEIVKLEKVKKPRTQKQIDAFKAVLEIRNQKRTERKEVRESLKIEKSKQIDEKIVQKALIIKKKEVRDDLLKKLVDKDEVNIENEIKELKLKLEKSKPKEQLVVKPVFIYR